MRKIFTLFAAMLIAFTASAKTWNVGPNHNEESDRSDCNLYVTLERLAQAGDTILMADGSYIETLTMNVKGKVVVMAADKAKPVVKQSSYINLYANAKFENIKFEHVGSSNGYCMYFQDGCKRLEMQNCEITNFKETCIMSWATHRVDSLILNNCYIHNNIKSVIYEPNGFIAHTVITNSTIVNNDASPWSAAIIDIRKDTVAVSPTLVVNNCTFYNNKTNNSDYADIRPRGLMDCLVSNCIFAHPVSYNRRATRFGESSGTGTVRNCLTYNYTKDTSTKGHTDATTIACSSANPLFKDGINGDFTLALGSPALNFAGKEVNGTTDSIVNLGDPRWVKENYQIYLKLNSDWNQGNAKFALWNVTKSTWVGMMTLAENETDVYTIEVPASAATIIFVRLSKDATEPDWDKKWNQTKDISIESGKDFFTITGKEDDNPQKYIGTWSMYGVKYYMEGSMIGWDGDRLPIYSDTYTIENLAAGTHYLRVYDGARKGLSAMTEVAGGLYPDGSDNICLKLSKPSDVTVTYIKDGSSIDTYELDGDFVAPEVALIGDSAEFHRWAKGDSIVLTPSLDKKSASVTIASVPADDYELKVIFERTQWLGWGTGETKFWITDENHSVNALGTDKNNLLLKATEVGDYTFTWTYATGTLDVTFPSAPTAIDETNVGEKAVKVLRNGQLFIEKDGKTYNVLGTVVK